MGLVRIVCRGRRVFRKVLKKEGLLEEVVDVFMEEFFVEVDWKGMIFRKERD